MGLDMYLSKRSYVKNWDFMGDEEKHSVNVTKNGQPTNIKPERVSYVEEQIMYWRKSNQIHGWFVNNTEEVSNNVKYRVSKTDLEVLLETCKKVVEVLNGCPKKTIQVVGGWKDGKEYMVDVETFDGEDVEDIVKEILPPKQGFFFGGYEIDNWYKEDIENTIKFLEEELPNCKDDDEFEYYASW
jgi:hypothetical protein